MAEYAYKENVLLTEDMERDFPIKILLVDDRAENLLSLEAILKDRDYTLVKATSGRQALKHLLHENDFALILMDVVMPEMDGFETAKLIYTREKLKTIPIIFLTANSVEDDIFKGYEIGAVDYLSKPIVPALLKAKVDVFVELSLKNQKLKAQEQNLRLINLNLEREIQERKQSEEKINTLNRDLAKKLTELQALDAFAHSVAHDLKSPLNGISGLTQILIEQHSAHLDDEARMMLNLIGNSVKNMSKLINDLLVFSRHGNEELTKKEVSMDEVVKSVIQEITEQKPEMETRFVIKELPGSRCDASLIKQVWINFISNAIKYSQHRTLPVVEIGAYSRSHESIYYIRDNGMGFDMKNHDKLFAIFQRLPEAKDFEGTGVGLALVKRIIERHGGRVWAEGQPEVGATFYFSVP